jgi:hypothetical protein
MAMTFRPAIRSETPLIIGLAGPSKSGKTFSALRLAVGLANGGPIAMINTEGARGHMYAEWFQYSTLDLSEPFAYSRYREAVLAANAIGPKVLIIDSVSHAHEGEGGMLDQQEKFLQERAGDDYKKRERLTWTAWIKPKAEEAQFINTLIRSNFSIILCFRAKEKLKIVKGADPIPRGFQPICSERIPFETTATLILPPGSQGTPDLSAQASGLRKPLETIIKDEQIDEELGKRLGNWAAGARTASPEAHDVRVTPPSGTQPPASAAPNTGIDDEIVRDIELWVKRRRFQTAYDLCRSIANEDVRERTRQRIDKSCEYVKSKMGEA